MPVHEIIQISADQMRGFAENPETIRNIAILGERDEFSRAVFSRRSFFVGSRPACWGSADYPRDPSVFRVKCSTVSQVFQLPEESQENNRCPFLINITDENTLESHSNLSSLFRMCDGVVLVTDVLEPVTEDTHAILRNTLDERVKPILFIDNVQQLILQKVPQETLYTSLCDAIQNINDILSAHPEPDRVDATEGSVVFGSGLHDWAFTLRQFARRYSKKFGIDQEKMLQRLWGDHFFNPTTKKWSRQDDGTLPRAFCQLVLEPIYTLSRVVMDSDTRELDRILEKLDITLDPDERKYMQGKRLLKSIMSKFLPLSDALLEAVVIHLPSPVAAQRYRADILYDGPTSDDAARGIQNCDPAGPLVVHISRMMPILWPDTPADEKRLWAFGRVFSGTLRRGQKVRILGPRYVPGQKDDFFVHSIGDLIVASGGSVQPGVEEIPAGSFVGIQGVENFLVQSGTLTDCETTCPMRDVGHSSVAVVQVRLEILKFSEFSRLMGELWELPKRYPLARTWISHSGLRLVIAGPDEIQVDMFVKYLKGRVGEDTFQASAPTALYRETITTASSMTAVCESPNKQIRISATATPLKPSLTRALEESAGGFRGPTMRHERFADATGWTDAQIRSKVWCFGPEDRSGAIINSANVLANATRGHHMLACKKDIMSGFQSAMTGGVCTEEPMRGVQLDIVGWQLEPGKTSSMRGRDDITPMVRRVCHAAILLAKPSIQEPIYSGLSFSWKLDYFKAPDQSHLTVEIHHSEPGQVDAIRTYLESRRGVIIEDTPNIKSRATIKAHLPVSESFGLATHLESTFSATVTRMVFDHWRTVPGSVLEEGTPAHQLATSIRIRKDLEPAIPLVDSYLDVA
ncbi:P-loop containing nucleoside triphosphate hydrolase protein [Roridomyces roridus]|uniref:P-loop containing nucleoside triphosphate hydrolase protein n=1 Tax=Roridomyces roridus TaxID=1738132 RepID=A0AAD7B3E1_9AGAR|nr:P-loop containing nucleoside triphosphate hydrolase protein [Roridomyces roridus]